MFTENTRETVRRNAKRSKTKQEKQTAAQWDKAPEEEPKCRPFYPPHNPQNVR